jgi:hypothetical protein
VLKNIFGSKRDIVTKKLICLYNELRALFSAPDVAVTV